LRLPVGVVRTAGVLCLTAVTVYLVWSARRKEPISISGWLLPVPPPGIAIAQLTVAALDWAAAGAVLYVLLPHGIGLGFLAFLGAFLLAQFAGLISHVPGGAGVFGTLMVILLAPWAPAAPVLGALVAYRAIYYLLPFSLAVLMLAAYEIQHRSERVVVAISAAGALAGKTATTAPSPTSLSPPSRPDHRETHPRLKTRIRREGATRGALRLYHFRSVIADPARQTRYSRSVVVDEARRPPRSRRRRSSVTSFP